MYGGFMEKRYFKRIKLAILGECALIAFLGLWLCFTKMQDKDAQPVWQETAQDAQTSEKKYIKWVEFHVPEELMTAAYQLDVATYGEKNHLDWIELLACLAARHGGHFPAKSLSELEKLAKALQDGDTTIAEQTKKLEYYPYYKEAYEAVLGGFVGEYKIEKKREDGSLSFEDCYGLKAFSPIAKGFYYEDYDDFGASRSFGYARPHLGHDMMGQVGTPIIAIESGYVEALGWNRYGGWRIGIRSFDKKRYYYYAHLRQNFPYNKELKEGSVVTAGDVIGYMGHTGYSDKENVNNIKVTHLHWGLQLIFDESQKEGNNEIWVDCYQLTKFLYKNRSETKKEEETKEWRRVYDMKDPAVEDYLGKKVRLDGI